MSNCIWCEKPLNKLWARHVPHECGRCWELRVRIQADLRLARMMLEVLELESEKEKKK